MLERSSRLNPFHWNSITQTGSNVRALRHTVGPITRAAVGLMLGCQAFYPVLNFLFRSHAHRIARGCYVRLLLPA